MTTPIAQGPVDVNVRPWFRCVTVGDMLHPIPLWNQTERGPNCLTVPVEVRGIKHEPSQTGVLFEVKTKGGFTRWLDAGWFKRPIVQADRREPIGEASSPKGDGRAAG